MVHAIEPQQECVSLVERNAALNGLPQLKAYTLALADGGRIVELLWIDAPSAAAGLGRQEAEAIDGARRDPGDLHVANEQLGRIDLLKLDAAGNELAVLRGARSLLEGGAIDERHLQALPP